MNPCNANSIPFADVRRPTSDGDDSPDDLMARNHRIPRSDDPSFYDVEISSANATDRNPHQHLAVRRRRVSKVRGLERRGVRPGRVGSVQDERAQVTASVLDPFTSARDDT
jgi:hypothetical protein